MDFQIPRGKSVPNDQKSSKINQNQPQIIKFHPKSAKNHLTRDLFFVKKKMRFLLKSGGDFLNFLNFDSGGDCGVDFQIPREKSIPSDQKSSQIDQNRPQIINNHQKSTKKKPKIICTIFSSFYRMLFCCLETVEEKKLCRPFFFEY